MYLLEPAPEFIWRLSKYEDKSGRGGLRASGRWHTRPRSMIYCGRDAHTAFLEYERITGGEMFFPDGLFALKIAVPRRAKMEILLRADLDPAWSDEIDGYSVCQPIGDAWITSIRTPLLCVPSVTGDDRYNVLVNSAHPDADDLEIADTIAPELGHPFPDYIRKP